MWIVDNDAFENSTATRDRTERAAAAATTMLGLAALTHWTSFRWVLYEAGLPWWPWAWLPVIVIAGCCFHVAARIRHNRIPAVSGLVAAAGWLLLLGLDAAWWLR